MISGLVVYFSRDCKLAEAAKLSIGQQAALELGPQEGRRLPLVLETTTSSESQDLTDWLKDLDGVEHVDVAFVHLEESSAALEPSSNCSQLRN